MHLWNVYKLLQYMYLYALLYYHSTTARSETSLETTPSQISMFFMLSVVLSLYAVCCRSQCIGPHETCLSGHVRCYSCYHWTKVHDYILRYEIKCLKYSSCPLLWWQQFSLDSDSDNEVTNCLGLFTTSSYKKRTFFYVRCPIRPVQT